MAKYRYIYNGWSAFFTKGEIYDEKHTYEGSAPVKECIKRRPDKWQLIEDDFVLPKNWYIILDAKNKSLVQEWWSQYEPINYRKWNYGSAYGWENKKVSNRVPGYFNELEGTEITFEQFKKHVLGMKDKKIIGYKLKDESKSKAVDALTKEVQYKYLMGNPKVYDVIMNAFSIRDFKEAGVLDIWFEPVYEKEYKLPVIAGYEGKDLGNSQVKYGCKVIKVSTLRDLLNLGKIDIVMSETVVGYQHIKQILEYFDNK